MSTRFTVFWGEGDEGPVLLSSEGARESRLAVLVNGHPVPQAGTLPWQSDEAAAARFEGRWIEALGGEFSLCAFDAATRTLHAGHDPFGLHSIFYARLAPCEGNGWLVSNALADLLPYVADRTLDRDYLAHFLTQGVAPEGRTPFRAIRSLRPSERLAVGVDGVANLVAYRRPVPEILTLPDEDDYVARLEGILDDVFAPIGATARPLLCEVSGGTDSALVFAQARKHRGDGFSTVSVLYTGTERGDETRWVNHVLEGFDGERIFVDGTEIPFFAGAPEGFVPQPCFHLINADDFRRTQAIYQAGYGDVLTGLGGDSVFFGDGPKPYYLADLLRRLRLREAAGVAASWQAESMPSRSALWWLGVYGLRPLLARENPFGGPQPPPAYMLAQTPAEGAVPTGPVADGASVFQAYLLHRVARYAANIRLHYDPLVTGIPYRFPLLDRRVVDFSLSLPHPMTFRGGRDRILHRRALARAGQERVAARRGKSGPEELVFRGLRENPDWRDRLADNPRLAELGLVDARKWTEEVDLVLVGFSNSLFHFETAAALEIWLQGLANMPAAKPPGSRVGREPAGRP